MSEVTGAQRATAGIGVQQQATGGEPDWLAMTAEELLAFRDAENRRFFRLRG